MRKISVLLIICFGLGCSVGVIKEDKILEERYISDEFNYVPNRDEVKIRFRIDKSNIVGRLYKQKKEKLYIKKKEVTKFKYDEQGTLLTKDGDHYWFVQVLAWLTSFGIYIPFTIYDLTSAYYKLGESAELETTELKPVDSFEFQKEYFQNGLFTISVKGMSGFTKVIDSEFNIPISALIDSNESEIEYSLYGKDGLIKSDKVPYYSDHITGDSKMFQNWKANIANEIKRKEENSRKWEQKMNQLFNNYLARIIRYPGFPACRDDRSIELKKWEYKGSIDCGYTNPNTGYTMWYSKMYMYAIEIECTQRYYETRRPIYKTLYLNTNNDISEDTVSLKCTQK